MSRAVICLVSLSPESSSGQPEDVTGRHTVLKRPCFGWGLHGVSRCRKTGSLLHCLFTLTPAKAGAVLFCCTFPGVASAGRYPASCPVKPGLSSDAVHKGHPSATACFTRAYHTNYKAHSGVAQEIFECRTAVNRAHLHCCKRAGYHKQLFMISDPFVYTSKQLPPINSRRIEFLGTSSDGYIRK